MFSLDICRICEKQSHLIDISLNSNYTEQYLIMNNVSYDNDDGLPQFFCRFCITQLLHFVKFKQKCEETYKKLKNLLLIRTNVEIKTELSENEDYQNESCFVIDNYEHLETKIIIDGINLQATTVLSIENNDDKNESLNYDLVNADSVNCLNIQENQKESNKIQNESLSTVLNYDLVNTDSVHSLNIKKESNEIHPVSDNTSKSTKMNEDYQNESSIVIDNYEYPETKIIIDDINLQTSIENNDDNNESLLNNLNYDVDNADSVHTYNMKKELKQIHRVSDNTTRSTKMKPFICDICETKMGMCFENLNQLELHISIFHRMFTNLRQCEECGYNSKWYTTENLRIHHKKAHTIYYKCKKCKKCYSKMCKFIEHTSMHSKEKPYKCQYCGRSYNKYRLIQHLKTHTDERTFKCDSCEKSFFRKQSLADHARTHTGEKPFKCDKCGQCYTQKCQLSIHLRTHTGEKPFKCKYCEKCFVQTGHLTTHMKIHTADRAFKCEYCEKCFTAKQSLDRHTRTHTGERPYKCKYCEKCFKENGHLSSHTKTHFKEKKKKKMLITIAGMV